MSVWAHDKVWINTLASFGILFFCGICFNLCHCVFLHKKKIGKKTHKVCGTPKTNMFFSITAREEQALAKDPPNSPNLCKNSHIVLSQSPTVLYNILFKAVYKHYPNNLQITTGSRPTTPHFIKNLPVRHTYIFHNITL